MPTSPNSATSNDATNPATTTKASHPVASVSLGAVRSNFKALKAFAGGAECSAVVKADAYGHGMTEVANALLQEGCATFFVAYASEGMQLRHVVGSEPKIYVFHGANADEVVDLVGHDLTPVINSADDLQTWLTTSASRTPYALHVDTGMNRLGLSPDIEIGAASELAETYWAPELVMSHMACADTPDHALNPQQLTDFRHMAMRFPSARKSLSATAAMYLGSDYHFDLVRPGIGLYGGGPARPFELGKLKVAMQVTASILKTFDVPEGAPIGYGSTFVTRHPTRLATCAIGYADGYLRSGSNAGFAVIDGCPCPVMGRVSMDLTIIDVSDLPEPPLPGTRAEFIGPQAGLEIQAEALGTLGYELTSRLGGRICRNWTD